MDLFIPGKNARWGIIQATWKIIFENVWSGASKCYRNNILFTRGSDHNFGDHTIGYHVNITYVKDNLDNTYADDEDAEIAESGSGSALEYSVNASDYYCEVIQKENAVLYVTAYPDYKEEAAAIIDSLGY